MAIGALISLIHVKAYLLCIDFQPLYIFPQIVFLSLRIVNRSKFVTEGFLQRIYLAWEYLNGSIYLGVFLEIFLKKKNGKIDHVCFILDNRSCLVRGIREIITDENHYHICRIFDQFESLLLMGAFFSPAFWKLIHIYLIIVSELLKMIYPSLLKMFFFLFSNDFTDSLFQNL